MSTQTTPATEPARLAGSQVPLAQAHDVALLDLDGVCFAGEASVPHAAQSVNTARAGGMGFMFVTNNASRSPQAVVDKLAASGIKARTSEVFSAAMDGAALLAEHVPAGSTVLVVGGQGLREALVEQGFVLVERADDAPAAVVQGWDPAVDWAMLSEGAYAITAGALHVATNMDATLPTERGFALGNGSLVTALANATGKDYLAGGKPLPGIYRRALQRSGGSNPVAVGDRLGTDIVGARSSGLASLHVLTGVSTARDVIVAAPLERPGFLHTDLRGLLEPHPWPTRCDDWWVAGTAQARVADGRLELGGRGVLEAPATVGLDEYRALAAAAWDYADAAGEQHVALEVPEIRVAPPAGSAQ